MTLPTLRKARFFKDWEGFVASATTRAARNIVRTTIDELIDLGPRPTKKQAMLVLQRFMEGFNEMADKIDTVSRENICDVFDEIIRVAGIKGCHDLADKWRDF